MKRPQDHRISVLIADDHRLLGEALGTCLEASGGFAVAYAATLDEALAEIGAGDPFDVVLLDLDMPGMAGIAGLERAVAANGGRVVLFSGVVRSQGALAALEAGAAGYFPKTMSPSAVAAAIRLVVAGETYFPASETMRQTRSGEADPVLSKRESDVLRGLCAGATNRDIADDLGLSEISVKMHVRTLCTKLGAANRTHAAVIGLTSGLV